MYKQKGLLTSYSEILNNDKKCLQTSFEFEINSLFKAIIMQSIKHHHLFETTDMVSSDAIIISGNSNSQFLLQQKIL